MWYRHIIDRGVIPDAILRSFVRYGLRKYSRNVGKLTDAQLQYCSNDVIYLHRIKDELHKMLVRENRLELYNSSIEFLKTRIKLDQSGFTEDIFQH